MSALYQRLINWIKSMNIASICGRRRRPHGGGILNQLWTDVSTFTGAAGATHQLTVKYGVDYATGTDVTALAAYSSADITKATVDAPTFTSLTSSTVTQGDSNVSHSIVGTNLRTGQTIAGLTTGVTAASIVATSDTAATVAISATGSATTGTPAIYIADPTHGNSGTQTLTVAALSSSTTFDPATLGTGMALSGGNLIATCSQGSDTGAKSVASHSTGKYYWEMYFNVMAGGDTGIGIGNAASTYAGLAPSATGGVMVYNNGAVYYNGSGAGLTVGTPTVNTVPICFALDLTNNKIWIRNGAAGGWVGGGTNDPTDPTGGGLSISTIAASALSAIATCNSSGDKITANFGGSAFAGTVPTGYTSGF